MALAIPKKDPLIKLKIDDDFFNLNAIEDEKLLATGKWDDEKAEDESNG